MRGRPAKLEDYKDKKYEKLTITDLTYRMIKGKKVTYAVCNCDCGTEGYQTRMNSILSKRTTSCGCAHGEKGYIDDLSGKRFERLLVLEISEKKNNKGWRLWKCQCDCENIVYVDSDSLKRGNTKSCSCLKEDSFEYYNPLKKYREKYIVDGTNVQSIASEKLPSHNTSGYKNISTNKGKYLVQLRHKGKTYNLGNYEYLADAIKVRDTGRNERINGTFDDWFAKYRESK